MGNPAGLSTILRNIRFSLRTPPQRTGSGAGSNELVNNHTKSRRAGFFGDHRNLDGAIRGIMFALADSEC